MDTEYISTDEKKFISMADHMMRRKEDSYVDIINEYVEMGGDVNRQFSDETTLLHYSSAMGHLNCMKALIEAGAKINKGDFYGRPPLYYAVCSGRRDAVLLLLKLEAELILPYNQNILDIAMKKKYIEILEILENHIASKIEAKPAGKHK